MERRAEDTTLWAVLFLIVAVAMTVAGLAWIAFGPPIT
jgi:hypothetical protein